MKQGIVFVALILFIVFLQDQILLPKFFGIDAWPKECLLPRIALQISTASLLGNIILGIKILKQNRN